MLHCLGTPPNHWPSGHAVPLAVVLSRRAHTPIAHTTRAHTTHTRHTYDTRTHQHHTHTHTPNTCAQSHTALANGVAQAQVVSNSLVSLADEQDIRATLLARARAGVGVEVELARDAPRAAAAQSDLPCSVPQRRRGEQRRSSVSALTAAHGPRTLVLVAVAQFDVPAGHSVGAEAPAGQKYFAGHRVRFTASVVAPTRPM